VQGSRRSPGLRDGEAFLAYLSRLPILCAGAGQWLLVKDLTRLQWRDRAGFAPASVDLRAKLMSRKLPGELEIVNIVDH
jgi:hypothetical protein